MIWPPEFEELFQTMCPQRSSICSVGEAIHTKPYHFHNWLNPIMENIIAYGSYIVTTLPTTRLEEILHHVLIFQNHIRRVIKLSLVFVLP